MKPTNNELHWTIPHIIMAVLYTEHIVSMYTWPGESVNASEGENEEGWTKVYHTQAAVLLSL